MNKFASQIIILLNTSDMPLLYETYVQPSHFVIAADGAANRVVGKRVDAIVGDFDSVNESTLAAFEAAQKVDLSHD
jgi:thiamine pyrophosphokinase